MSRIGKKAIDIPEKVEVKVDGSKISVKGPKGALSYEFSTKLGFKVNGKSFEIEPKSITTETKALWGMSRTVVSNMLTGVSVGFTKDLEFTGVGYRAAVSGTTLTLNMGYSHSVDYKLPQGIEAKVNKNVITISGANKESVGLVAADVRSIREPEPYKGKGIKYATEKIIRKAGKTGSKK